jgi:hypothetical protein
VILKTSVMCYCFEFLYQVTRFGYLMNHLSVSSISRVVAGGLIGDCCMEYDNHCLMTVGAQLPGGVLKRFCCNAFLSGRLIVHASSFRNSSAVCMAAANLLGFSATYCMAPYQSILILDNFLMIEK